MPDKKSILLKKMLIIAMGILLASGWGYARADEIPTVALICSAKMGPYEKASQTLEQELRRQCPQVKITPYYLDEAKPKDVYDQLQKQPPALICSLGTSATKLAEKIDHVNTVYTLIFETDEFDPQRMTGVTLDVGTEEKLAMIRAILPEARKIGVLYSSRSEARFKELEKLARKNKLTLIAREVKSEKDFPQALKDILEQADCFLMMADAKLFFPKSVEHLLRESIKKRVPVMGLSSVYTRAGALFSLDVDFTEIGKQTGEVAARVLQQKTTAAIPVTSPRKTYYSLNLSTAKRLGIELSSNIVKRAGEVFGR
jgi:putative ABC transport system substrate-binding protein